VRTAPAPSPSAVEVEALKYRYGDREALRDVDFSVTAGEIFGLLGPNGGGKTTLFRILSTLLVPDHGRARIFGVDVVQQPLEVRRRIGVVFQNQSLDRRLTAQENLLHQGHLYGLHGEDLKRRIDHVLDKVGLTSRRGDVVETLSGGLRRRVELAKGFLHQPKLLLLDEPSSGVDPGARLDFWNHLQRLRQDEGVTVLLTTHLLDEAEKCDRLAILDQGSLVAQGTPAELKTRIGGDVVTLSTSAPDQLAVELQRQFELPAQVLDGKVRFEHSDGAALVGRLMQAIPQRIDSMTVSHPTLEDVFIHVTGHRFSESAENQSEIK
jgi:ABC-2 type transport system ATP-binding protein